MENKKLDKAFKVLGDEGIKEIESLGEAELKALVTQAAEAMRLVAYELEANEQYKAAKEATKLLSEGRREVDKRQKAIILVALHVLNSGHV